MPSPDTRKVWASVIAVIGLLLVALNVHNYLHRNRTPVFAGDTTSQLQIRQKVACPPTGADTLVIFGIGQSNAGNHGPAVDVNAVANPHVFEFWRGSCYLAASPSLGATGTGESLWPALGQSLIASGVAKNVIFGVFSVDGASIRRFTNPNDLKPYWIRALQGLLVEHPVDYVVWIQGEGDFARKTTQDEYVTMFGHVESDIRAQTAAAPILVSRQTYCVNGGPWVADNPVARAQVAVVNPSKGVLAGPDTDQVLGAAEGLRWDGCHPSLFGFKKWALAWTGVITQHRKDR